MFMWFTWEWATRWFGLNSVWFNDAKWPCTIRPTLKSNSRLWYQIAPDGLVYCICVCLLELFRWWIYYRSTIPRSVGLSVSANGGCVDLLVSLGRASIVGLMRSNGRLPCDCCMGKYVIQTGGFAWQNPFDCPVGMIELRCFLNQGLISCDMSVRTVTQLSGLPLVVVVALALISVQSNIRTAKHYIIQ